MILLLGAYKLASEVKGMPIMATLVGACVPPSCIPVPPWLSLQTCHWNLHYHVLVKSTSNLHIKQETLNSFTSLWTVHVAFSRACMAQINPE